MLNISSTKKGLIDRSYRRQRSENVLGGIERLSAADLRFLLQRVRSLRLCVRFSSQLLDPSSSSTFAAARES